MNKFLLKNGVLFFEPNFLSSAEATNLFANLLEETQWQQQAIQLFGKKVNLPRLTAWYGTPGIEYEYSGIRVSAQTWTDPLLVIKEHLEEVFSATFNSVLINRYRDGNDSVAWHADDEASLGVDPTIASVSVGATRRFTMKHRFQKSEKFALDLTHGSALLMSGATQHYWLHKIPKTRKVVGQRINLTFRNILGC